MLLCWLRRWKNWAQTRDYRQIVEMGKYKETGSPLPEPPEGTRSADSFTLKQVKLI